MASPLLPGAGGSGQGGPQHLWALGTLGDTVRVLSPPGDTELGGPGNTAGGPSSRHFPLSPPRDSHCPAPRSGLVPVQYWGCWGAPRAACPCPQHPEVPMGGPVGATTSRGAAPGGPGGPARAWFSPCPPPIPRTLPAIGVLAGPRMGDTAGSHQGALAALRAAPSPRGRPSLAVFCFCFVLFRFGLVWGEESDPAVPRFPLQPWGKARRRAMQKAGHGAAVLGDSGMETCCGWPQGSSAAQRKPPLPPPHPPAPALSFVSHLRAAN